MKNLIHRASESGSVIKLSTVGPELASGIMPPQHSTKSQPRHAAESFNLKEIGSGKIKSIKQTNSSDGEYTNLKNSANQGICY